MQRLRDDEGAFAVLFALLLTFVLFGLITITVDVGAVYAESRQLQNAADATAVAGAADCAAAACTSTGEQTNASLVGLANANANDGATAIDEVCGVGRPGLTGCQANATGTAHWDCPPPPASGNYVEVRTSTKQTDGTGLLPGWFVRALPGQGGYAGVKVRSCARAAWGTPGSLQAAIPLTISKCEWSGYTSNGSLYAPPGPYPSPTAWPSEEVLYLHVPSKDPNCNQGPSGADLPGGFGWLAVATGCTSTTAVGQWVSDSTGRPAPNGCDTVLASLVGRVIDIPIYGDVNGITGTGAGGQYLIVGYAPFFLTGYYVNGGDYVRSLIDNKNTCYSGSGSANATCVKGFFTSDLVPSAGTISTGPSFGTTVVQLTG